MARPFKPGQSGNPAGKKPGTKNRKTILRQELEKDGSALALAIKSKALEGDPSCLALWLSRLEPPLRARAEKVTFDLDTSKSLHHQAQDIMDAIAQGRVDPDTGAMLIACLDKVGNLKAVEELEARLAVLEDRQV
jgi:hypothetical protein